jgi:hypothetical protein
MQHSFELKIRNLGAKNSEFLLFGHSGNWDSDSPTTAMCVSGRKYESGSEDRLALLFSR